MMTAAGSGYSRWGESLSRDGAKTPRETIAALIFLRDTQSGAVWSAGFQPMGVSPTNVPSISTKIVSKSPDATGL